MGVPAPVQLVTTTPFHSPSVNLVQSVGPAVMSAIGTPTPAPGGTSSTSSDPSPLQVWTLVLAALAVLTTLASAWLLRRTGKGTVEAAKKSANAAETSARASGRAASAAERAADASARATLAAETGTSQLEVRSKREETMRNLRWAAECSVDLDQNKARLGLAQLKALGSSDLLDAGQQLFIDAALQAVVRQPLRRIENHPGSSNKVEVATESLTTLYRLLDDGPVYPLDETEVEEDEQP